MKKNLIALAFAGVATLAGTGNANAQMVANSGPVENQKHAIGTTNSMNDMETISPRALKNFADTYKNVRGESWMKIKDGFSARFTSDGILTTIFYDSKGYWVASIKQYSEEKMLHEVRHIVKSTYYDYNIIYTQEVETADTEGMPTYIICLEDKTNIKMIRMCDGEMNVWKQFMKTN